jgi:adenylate kinase
MRKYVIMGVQGSGKGTQSSKLCEAFGLEHISVGDIFRWNIAHHTKLGAQVRRLVDAGHLVSDDIVESVVRVRLEQHDWNHGFIVDGFPRNVPQAEFFLESYDIDAVIVLDLPDEEVQRRVLSRRVCSQCGLDYNLIAHRPAVADVCDVCGGSLEQREDDTHEALARRLGDYYAKTEPVIDVFGRKELVVRVDATPSKDEVCDAITDRVGLAGSSSVR